MANGINGRTQDQEVLARLDGMTESEGRKIIGQIPPEEWKWLARRRPEVLKHPTVRKIVRTESEPAKPSKC